RLGDSRQALTSRYKCFPATISLYNQPNPCCFNSFLENWTQSAEHLESRNEGMILYQIPIFQRFQEF
ncbi:MAG: hypothetical protein AB1589_45940, partial [Cyanobacteriota bacterium]